MNRHCGSGLGQGGVHVQHPRQPLMGRFENAFPVWRENLHRSFEFGVEVDRPVFPLLARIQDIQQSLLTKFFVARLEGESGKGIHRNLQKNVNFVFLPSTAPLPTGLGQLGVEFRT